MNDLTTGRIFKPKMVYVQKPKLSLNDDRQQIGYNPDVVAEFISEWLSLVDKLPAEGWPFQRIQSMMDLDVRLDFDQVYFDEMFGESESFVGMIHGLGEILPWQVKSEVTQDEALARLENTQTINTAFRILDTQVFREIKGDNVTAVFTIRPTGSKRSLFIDSLMKDKLYFVLRDVVTKKDGKVMSRLWSLDAKIQFTSNQDTV